MPEATNPQRVRSQNERLILWLIRRHGPMARAALAQATGLSAQSVTNITRDLIAAGLLDTGPRLQQGKRGQPLTPLGLVPGGAYFLGLKVGRRLAELVLVDFVGTIVSKQAMAYAFPQPDQIIAFALAGIAQMRADLAPHQRERVAGLGIAIPFFLWDWGDEMLPWRGRDLRSEVESQIDLPVWLENDGSCACGAELVYGADDLPSDFIYFYIAHFAGGGLVLDSRLRLGARGNAGAMGSCPTVAGDQVLDRASVSGLEAMLGHELPADDSGWTLSPDIRRDWLALAAEALAHAALSAVAIADLPMVVVDGAMPPDLRDELALATGWQLSNLPRRGIARPEIRAGQLGRKARALGAAALPLSAGFLPGGTFLTPTFGRKLQET